MQFTSSLIYCGGLEVRRSELFISDLRVETQGGGLRVDEGGGRGVMLVCIFIQLSGHGQTVFPRPRSDDDYTRGDRLNLLDKTRPSPPSTNLESPHCQSEI